MLNNDQSAKLQIVQNRQNAPKTQYTSQTTFEISRIHISALYKSGCVWYLYKEFTQIS